MMRQYELVERVRRYNPNADEDLLNRAYVFAMKAHGTQKRASGDPYFSHPLEVAAILTELKVDDATIVAAMLHDTIEDTTITREDVDKAFGEEIGGLVDGLTKLGKLDFVTKHAQQAENFRKLLLAIADDARVLLVKLADRLHNMRTLHFMPEDKRARIAEDTLDIYAPLAGRMGMQSMRSELEDLSFRCLMPDAYALIVSRLEAMKAKNGAIIARIAAELTDQFVRRGIKVEVKGRQKQPYSIWKKMERRSIAFEQLSDIYGFRILVDTVADCYAAVGVAHTTWPMRAGALQGLHFDAEAERLPFDPHHGHRARQPARRTADPHPRDARSRRIRHRRAYDLQGRDRRRDAGGERKPRLPRPEADDRGAGERRFGEVPRTHQARAVSRPGVLLHAQGAADRLAAGRDRDRFRLCGPYRHRQFGGRREDQRPHRAADLRAAERRRSAHLPFASAVRRRRPGTASS